MNKKAKLTLLVAVTAVVAGFTTVALLMAKADVLNPRGTIAGQERDLFIFTALLSLIVVVPVYVMLFGFAWKYRAGNHKAKYSPNWDHSRLAETIWWTVPLLLILILAVVTYKSSHDLDPFKPLNSSAQPLKVQVIALQWKWLFIYPEQNIATVNMLQIPVNRPVNFEITADAPMNSFWIPQLGGQIYAMAGMNTKLHLMATEAGDYRGSSANLSGDGFARMNFTARASSETNFRRWVNGVKRAEQRLDMSTYGNLAKPNTEPSLAYYSSPDRQLFHHVIMKYMTHDSAPATHGGHN